MHARSVTSVLSAVAFVLMVSFACGNGVAEPDDVQAPAPAGGQISGRMEALIQALRQQGATVTPMEKMSAIAHCLSIGAQRLVVNGENVYAFEYDTAERASRDASGISSDGRSIAIDGGVCMPGWTGPPRFYRLDRLITLYIGANQDLIRILDGILGTPFAHRE